MNNTIAIDVDGTLVVKGIANALLIEWINEQKSKGSSIMLWSMRGKEYAETAARACGVLHLFDVIASKPTAIVDDKGWGWIKSTRVISRLGHL